MTLLMRDNVTEMANLFQVSLGEIDEVWPHVEPLIADALERSSQHTSKDIYNDLQTGNCHLWVADHVRDGILGVMVTYLVTTELARICRIFLCVGEQRRRWIHHLGGVEDWARENGCKSVIAVVRPGWEKVMTDYRKTHVTLEKTL
tara:strand:- start:540 stop:977 length:438 start_codon:yes stop_codon:yes gene_type:complete